MQKDKVNIMLSALKAFKNSYETISEMWDDFSLNEKDSVLKAYPFDKSFDELSIREFCDAIAYEIRRPDGGYRQTEFCIEASEDHFVGYTDNSHWNGWECPLFEFDEATRVMKSFTSEECPATYDKDTDTFTFIMQPDDPDAIEHFEGMDIKVNGETKHVYAIGNGCWCWDEYEPINYGEDEE